MANFANMSAPAENGSSLRGCCPLFDDPLHTDVGPDVLHATCAQWRPVSTDGEMGFAIVVQLSVLLVCWMPNFCCFSFSMLCIDNSLLMCSGKSS